MVAGPAWLRIGPVPTNRPAPIIPPSEIMVMCLLFRPCCRWPSWPDPSRLSTPASATFSPSLSLLAPVQLTRYAPSFTTWALRHKGRPASDDDELQGPRGENLPSCAGHQAGAAQAHGDPAPGIGHHAMQEEDHPRLSRHRVPGKQHRPVHPVGAEGRAQRVPARGEAMLLEPRRIQYAAVGIVDLADRTSWCQGLGHLLERLANGR